MVIINHETLHCMCDYCGDDFWAILRDDYCGNCIQEHGQEYMDLEMKSRTQDPPQVLSWIKEGF